MLTAYYLIFCRDRLLITPGHALPLCSQPPLSDGEQTEWIRLPELDGYPVRATEVAHEYGVDGLEWTDLRTSFTLLSASHYAMAGKARELLFWAAGNRFCGACGAPMKWHTDISRRCTACGREIWPSPAAAMIVAITRNAGREILLVQSRSFKKDYLGLVAGFVESGENLETCVHREILEETGLRVRNLRYFASQPWPYPFSLMVGFTAEYESGELCLQESELRKGGWFDAAHLPPIPGKVSLARRLIDHWLETQADAASPVDGDVSHG